MKTLLLCSTLALSVAVGRAEDIKLTDGTTFKDATITRRDVMTAKITHADGIATVKCADLAPEWQAKIGYDAASIRTAQAQRQKWAEEAEKAAQERQAANARLAARPSLEGAPVAEVKASAGEMPIVLPERAPACITRVLKSRLKDPDSLRYAQVGTPVPVRRHDELCWAIPFTYRARNSFGGYVLAAHIAFIQKGSVIELATDLSDLPSNAGDIVIVPSGSDFTVRQLPTGVSYLQSVGGWAVGGK